ADCSVDGVVTLGAIIQGDTDHDALIAYTVAEKITGLSMQFSKPVTLGISGPKMTLQQAIERIEFFGKNSVEACVKLIQRLR
ncbi:6,7-dimethyl-8-ribityllumazine synthase, partial [Candidatus Woesearchaeota archaeon]|nr:6,7-dimethyl-8-ribityllumazine synthase [Candidatus Woesearchaeota archaeon]